MGRVNVIHAYVVDPGERHALIRGRGVEELFRALRMRPPWSTARRGWLLRSERADDVLVLAEANGWLVRVHGHRGGKLVLVNGCGDVLEGDGGLIPASLDGEPVTQVFDLLDERLVPARGEDPEPEHPATVATPPDSAFSSMVVLDGYLDPEADNEDDDADDLLGCRRLTALGTPAEQRVPLQHRDGDHRDDQPDENEHLHERQHRAGRADAHHERRPR